VPQERRLEIRASIPPRKHRDILSLQPRWGDPELGIRVTQEHPSRSRNHPGPFVPDSSIALADPVSSPTSGIRVAVWRPRGKRCLADWLRLPTFFSCTWILNTTWCSRALEAARLTHPAWMLDSCEY